MTTIGAAGAAVTFATGATEVITVGNVAWAVVKTGGALTEVTTGGTLPSTLVWVGNVATGVGMVPACGLTGSWVVATGTK